jgi:hypothetical protein
MQQSARETAQQIPVHVMYCTHSTTCEISIEVLSQQVKSCGRHHRKLHKQIVYVEVDERTACEGIELPDDPTPFFDVFAEPSFWKTHHKNNFLGLKKAK